MYGYDLPSYVREYQKMFQKYDRFLRVRRSLDNPGMYVVERKTRYIEKLECKYGTDRQVRYKDDYRLIYKIWPCDFKFVMDSLRATDIQKQGGARRLADELDARDYEEQVRIQRKNHDDFEQASSSAYDRLAWAEGRRVSMAGAYKG